MECCSFWMLSGAALLAACVGILTGIFGVGGGFLITPALMIVFAIPGPTAVGTGVAMIFTTSCFGLYKRRNSKTINVKLSITIGIASGIGVLAGIMLLEYLKKLPMLIIFGKEQVAVQYILLLLFMAILSGLALFMWYDCNRSDKPEGQKGLLTNRKFGPTIHIDHAKEDKIPIAPIAVMGVFIGVLTGLLGIGGGVLMFPCLIYLVGQNAACAAGTSLMIVWLSTLVGVAGHIKAGNVNCTLLVALLIGGFIGIHYGTNIGLKLNHSKICKYFVHIVVIAAALVIYKLLNLTFW